jgi:hypothetical protein
MVAAISRARVVVIFVFSYPAFRTKSQHTAAYHYINEQDVQQKGKNQDNNQQPLR